MNYLFLNIWNIVYWRWSGFFHRYLRWYRKVLNYCMGVRLVLQNVFLLFFICSLSNVMYSITSFSLFFLRNSFFCNQFLSILLYAASMIKVLFVAAGISVWVIWFYRIQISWFPLFFPLIEASIVAWCRNLMVVVEIVDLNVCIDRLKMLLCKWVGNRLLRALLTKPSIISQTRRGFFFWCWIIFVGFRFFKIGNRMSGVFIEWILCLFFWKQIVFQ